MSYTSTTDVQFAAGGQAMLDALADFDADGQADAPVIESAQAAADAEIDSYACKRYHVPLAVPPAKVVELAARLAVFKLRTQRQTLTQGDLEQNKVDIAWLEGVRDGTNTLGVDPGPEKSALQVDQAGSRDSTKYVSRERLKGYW